MNERQSARVGEHHVDEPHVPLSMFLYACIQIFRGDHRIDRISKLSAYDYLVKVECQARVFPVKETEQVMLFVYACYLEFRFDATSRGSG